jgi:hypothetical protein
MSTVFSSTNFSSTDAASPNGRDTSLSFQHIVDYVLSGKGLRLAVFACLAFLVWKAFQGLRSLFWVAFGLAWALFWARGGVWF